VPSKLTSEIRIGVAPHETVDEVERRTGVGSIG
jgi:hypothetical protein